MAGREPFAIGHVSRSVQPVPCIHPRRTDTEHCIQVNHLPCNASEPQTTANHQTDKETRNTAGIVVRGTSDDNYVAGKAGGSGVRVLEYSHKRRCTTQEREAVRQECDKQMQLLGTFFLEHNDQDAINPVDDVQVDHSFLGETQMGRGSTADSSRTSSVIHKNQGNNSSRRNASKIVMLRGLDASQLCTGGAAHLSTSISSSAASDSFTEQEEDCGGDMNDVAGIRRLIGVPTWLSLPECHRRYVHPDRFRQVQSTKVYLTKKQP
eukprot:GHVQ01032919.1.p1 GENE.GHVQ01032919.1~~GHVQ01032919.1.p1  ORF type:complete len:265 (+),score=25.82 GHVQ01032919.1:1216-2010(+)